MSIFWSAYIIIIVTVSLLGCAILLIWTRKYKPKNIAEGEKIDHDIDGIIELNNPLPRWWLWLFWVTLAFAIGYFALYPGLGNFKGAKDWSSKKEWQQNKLAYHNQFGPLFRQYASVPIPELAKNEEAMETAKRLFSNHCAICHGSDAMGMYGFPNLVRGTWIYGGTPDDIKQTILDGRKGIMPAMNKVIPDEASINELVQYLLMLNGREHDESKVDFGKVTFERQCSICHGLDAKGKKEMSAPNLTDNTWTYSGTQMGIAHSIRNGRQGEMPAHRAILGEDKVHLLAAYIYGISEKTEARELKHEPE